MPAWPLFLVWKLCFMCGLNTPCNRIIAQYKSIHRSYCKQPLSISSCLHRAEILSVRLCPWQKCPVPFTTFHSSHVPHHDVSCTQSHVGAAESSQGVWAVGPPEAFFISDSTASFHPAGGGV